MRALRRRPSLLTKFSLLSLLVVAAIGIAIGSVLHERIERRALLEATQLADVLTRAGLEPVLLRGDLQAYRRSTASRRSTRSCDSASSAISASSG